MRSTNLLLAALIVAITTSVTGIAQAQNLYPLTPVSDNHDTLMVDTTGFGTAVLDTFYDSLLYIRGNITVQFYAPVIPPDSLDSDSLVRYQWENIDTNYSQQRNSFADIDTSLSSLTLIKVAPGVDSGLASQRFMLDLSEYVHWYTLRDLLDAVDSMGYTVGRYDGKVPSHVPSDPGFDPRNSFPDLVGPLQQNWDDYVRFHRLGLAWHLYTIQAPLAWELTTGLSDVVVVADDDMRSGKIIVNGTSYGHIQSDHPELPPVSTPAGSGNYIVLNSGDWDALPLSPQTDDIGLGHGLLIAEAIGKADNGSGASGTCPDCRGSVVRDWSSTLRMDFDLTINGDLTPPDVLSMSYKSDDVESQWSQPSSPADRTEYLDALNEGIVLVASANNQLFNRGACASCSNYPSCVEGRESTGNQVWTLPDGSTGYEVLPGAYYPGARVHKIPDVAPSYDYVKVLAVGATMRDYSFWIPGQCNISDRYDRGDSKLGKEVFLREFTYSTGVNKFDETANAHHERERAFIDVVAPTGDGFHAVNGITDCDPDDNEHRTYGTLTHQCDDDDEVDWTDLSEWRYLTNARGTSHAVPLVAGIVGMMLSVQEKMGLSGPAVHHRVYDVVTMTADKVVDDGRYWGDGELDDDGSINDDPDGILCGDGKKYRIKPPEQPEYVPQVNDPLMRSWAQRMGFGRVNAYRAVAHAISEKGDYKYTSSATLLPDAARNGRKLMHMGWWIGKENGAKVSLYDYSNATLDGYDLPGASTNHNNQGKTVLDGESDITLTLGTDVILAVDGILETTGTSGADRIDGGTNGVICVAGHVDGVGIDGTLRLGDAIIDASDDVSPLLVASGSSEDAEFYGVVECISYGEIRITSAAATHHPGSVLSLDGSRDYQALSSSTVKMRHGSRIESDNRSVIVGDGSVMFVEDDGKAEIDARLVVKDGGTFIVKPGAEALVKSIDVEKGGEVRVEQGGVLTLTSPDILNKVAGRLRVIGVSGDLATVRARTAPCCLPSCDDVEATAHIRVEDDLSNYSDVTSTILEVKYGWIEDVQITTVNAPVLPIEHSTFAADRDKWDAWSPQVRFRVTDNVLMTDPYTPPVSGTASRESVQVQNCSFIDLQGEASPPVTRAYSIVGLRSDGLRRLHVTDSDFDFVRAAIIGGRGDVIEATGINVFKSDIGIYSVEPVLDVCNSYFTKTVYGVVNFAGMSGIYLDNLFRENRSGLIVGSSMAQYVRGNLFDQYLHAGLNVFEGTARLDEGMILFWNFLWGRNRFTHNGGSTYLGTPTWTTDIAQWSNRAAVQVKCGENLFASGSTYHRWSDIPVTVDGSINNYLPTSVPRPHTNVTVNGNTFNVSSLLGGCGSITDNHCGTQPNSAPFSTGLNTYWISGAGWHDLPDSSQYLDSAFQYSLTELQTTGLPYTSRIRKIADAKEAAIFGDSTEQKLQTLELVLRSIADDLTENIELRAEAALAQSTLVWRTGDFASTDSILLTFPNSYTRDVDTSLALWGNLQYVADTTSPDSLHLVDSAEAVAMTRSFDDVVRWTDLPGGAPKASPEAMTGTSLISSTTVMVAPNPARGRVSLRFSISAGSSLVIRIFDTKGSELRQIPYGNVPAGESRIDLQLRDLAEGSYLLVLDFGDYSDGAVLHVVQ